MKKDTTQLYQERINKALKFIEENINNDKKDLSLAAIASESNYSPEHIHRILKAYLKEPIGQYIKRLKIENAAKSLLFSKESITNIGHQIGFQGIESFSKAFKQIIGVSPKEYRNKYKSNPNNPKATDDFNRYLNTKITGYDDSDLLDFTSKIKNLQKLIPHETTFLPIRLLCIRCIGSYDDNNIEKNWNILLTYCNKNKIITPFARHFGIIHDDTEITEPNRLRYDACVTVTNEITSKNEFFIKEIPHFKAIKFIFKDKYSEIDNFYDMIFSDWFPYANVELANLPIIEEYLNNTEITPKGQLTANIYIPIR